jgi:predicted Zn-dependent peptidase
MNKFQSFHQARFHVHILQTAKFRTRHLSIKIALPLTRDTVTSTAILPYLLMEGTSTQPSAKDIIRRTDSLFGSVVQSSIGKRGDLHVMEVSAMVPEESGLAGARGLFEAVSGLALQVLTDPARGEDGFVTEHVVREKALHKRRIESVFDDKIAYAMERCMEEMCRNLPQGLHRLGYPEDLSNLSAATLWQAHQDALAEAQFHAYCVGQFDRPDDIAQNIIDHLARLVPTDERRVESHVVTAVQLQERSAPQTVQDEQEVSQGKLNLGFRTGVSYSQSEYLPLLVCNGVLGGFPHSKLFKNVREKESLAYYASSRLDGLTGVVAVQTGIDVKHYEKALNIIEEQVKAVQNGDVTEEEMAFTQRGLKNQYQQLLDQPMSMADVHFSSVLTGIERDATELLEGVSAVTRDEVIRASQHLTLDTIYFLRNKEEATHA